MASSWERGRRAERLVAGILEERGWTILDRNWRDGPRELDLVMLRAGVLAVVEVRSRSSVRWGAPLETVRFRKRREVERAARAWLRRRAPGIVGIESIRFDVVSVIQRPRLAPLVEHVEGAWRTGE